MHVCVPSKKVLSCPLRFQAGVSQRTDREEKRGREREEEGTVEGFSLSDGRKGGDGRRLWKRVGSVCLLSGGGGGGGHYVRAGMVEAGSDMKMGTVDVPRVLGLGLGW